MSAKPLIFKPRGYQLPFLAAMQGGCRLGVCVWHRRAGKDVCAWWWTIIEALRETGVYFYTFPTYAQGKKVIWDGMLKTNGQTIKYLHLIPEEIRLDKRFKINETEMQIELPPIAGGSNGSIIQIVGVDKIDYVMGTNPRGIVYSEYAIQSPEARKFLNPITTANKGWEVFVFTPRGPNHGFDVWEEAGRDEQAFRQLLTIDQTYDEDNNPIITKTEIDKKRANGEDEDFLQQEYYCSFAGSQSGSYYGSLVRKAWEEKRFGRVPFDPKLGVHTSWDLGRGDDTVIGFWQELFRERRLIDSVIDHGKGPVDYAAVLSERARHEGYRYLGHKMPHDADVKRMEAKLSIKQQFEAVKVRPITIVEKLSIQTGISAVRTMFPVLYIDEHRGDNAKVIVALTQYHKKYDEEKQQYSDEPVHDKYSHPADMVRYEATGESPREDYNDMDRQARQSFDPMDWSADEDEERAWADQLV